MASRFRVSNVSDGIRKRIALRFLEAECWKDSADNVREQRALQEADMILKDIDNG